jgi:hypothetical protein
MWRALGSHPHSALPLLHIIPPALHPPGFHNSKEKKKGAVSTLDRDEVVVPRPCKIGDWLLNSSHDHFGLHQEKKMLE